MSVFARVAPPLLVVIVLATACTVTRPVPHLDGPSEVVRRQLSNGVRVLVQEHPASDVVALQLWVAAGGRDEAPTELGLAHYLEHMLFKGTPSRPTGHIEREVEGVGGRINAGTSLDYTYYHAVLPARHAAAGIEMLADIAVNATLDAGTLEREKLVVLEEMRLSEDNPRRHLARHMYAVLLDGHPYGRPVIGTPELIRPLTRDTLTSFYARHYVPEAFTLVVVGAVDRNAVLGMAERTFGRLPSTGFRRATLPVVTVGEPRHIAMTRPGRHAYLGMGWLAPPIGHADTPALDLVVAILGQSRASRLTHAVRDRLGLVNTVSSGYAAMEGVGTVTITAQLEPANVERAEAAIVREIARLRDEGVSEAELRRAITGAEARQAFSTETAEGRAFALGRAETIWRVEEELAYVARLRAVTVDQLRAVAVRYLDPERYARLTFVPGVTP
jgi:zinc protease